MQNIHYFKENPPKSWWRPILVAFLVFNICEGYNGPARESVYAAILEQLNFNYTGPDSTNLLICHTKKKLIWD